MADISVSLFIETETVTTDGLSNQIGLKPDGGWSKGEPRGAAGKSYETSAWKLIEKTSVLETADDISEGISTVLDLLLERVSNRENNFRTAAATNTSGLLLTISSVGVPPLILKRDLLKAISRLGVDLEIDLVLR